MIKNTFKYSINMWNIYICDIIYQIVYQIYLYNIYSKVYIYYIYYSLKEIIKNNIFAIKNLL